MHTRFPSHIIYAVEPGSGNKIAIRIGEAGSHEITTALTIDELNGPKVRPCHVEAALAGLMFGWNTHAADPQDECYQRTPDVDEATLIQHESGIASACMFADRSICEPYYGAVQHAKVLIANANVRDVVSEGCWVRLASRGDPDREQDPEQVMFGRPPDVWMPARDALHASEIVRGYISTYNLCSGNWAGGELIDDGQHVATIAYNGSIHDAPAVRSASIFTPR